MAKLSTSQKLAAGRLWAAEKMPYLRVGLFSLVALDWDSVVHVGFPTFAVTRDGLLLVDERALHAWTVAQVGSVLVHELSHLLRDHAGRADALSIAVELAMEWNMAADREINDDLKAAGLELPPGGCYPDQIGMPDGLTAEAYFKAAMKLPRSKKPKLSPGTAQAANGMCGSGAGNPVPGEPKGRAKGTDPATADAPRGRSAAQLEAVRRQTAEAIRQHIEQKGRGSVPEGFSRWADDVLGPSKVDWRKRLARITRYALAYRPGAVDYRLDRPSRRQGAVGYGPGCPVLPALRHPIPKVDVYIDTSGSMGKDALTDGLREVKGVLSAVGARITLWVGDADVHGRTQVRTVEEAAALLVGGGGTDFRPVFKAIENARDKPDVLVMITDGDGMMPARAPFGVRVIWLIVGSWRRIPTEFGEVIEVDDDETSHAA